MSYYPLALNAFKVGYGLSGASQAAVGRALQSLKPSLRHLRYEYDRHSRTSTVSLDYTGALAAAYLLAYFPGNVIQSQMAFCFACVAEMAPAPQRVGLFCSGLAPEAVALTELLSATHRTSKCEGCFLKFPRASGQKMEECPNCGLPIKIDEELAKLDFLLFDHSPGWSQFCDAVMELGCRGMHNQHDTVADFELFTGLTPKQEALVRSLDLAVFQNFDNELGSKKESALRTVLRVGELLRPGSKLILSDLHNARGTHEKLKAEMDRRSLGPTSISPEDGRKAWHLALPEPFLRENLLDGTDGLIPRVGKKHLVNFLVLDRHGLDENR